MRTTPPNGCLPSLSRAGPAPVFEWLWRETGCRAVVDRLRQRFAIGRICIVADRGVISGEMIEVLESETREWRYIFGVRMRRQKRVSKDVLSRAGRYQLVHPKGVCAQDPAPLKVKEGSSMTFPWVDRVGWPLGERSIEHRKARTLGHKKKRTKNRKFSKYIMAAAPVHCDPSIMWKCCG